GGQTATAGPGTIVFIPRNVVHRFKNVGDTTACMLDWSLPGGQDRYFKAISHLAADDGFAREKTMEISKKFDKRVPSREEFHENRALPHAGNRIPDHCRADGPGFERPRAGRRRKQRGRPRYPASATLRATNLPRADPADSVTDRQAVRCESAVALPDRG